MRILALETDIGELQKKFLVEGEKAVCVTHRHFLAFFVNIAWQTLFSALALAVILFSVSTGLLNIDLAGILLAIVILTYGYMFFTAYVQWKFNFLIVTTQKVVMIEQRSLFYQHINPMHFFRISNTRVESQFGGFFHCGILYLSMMTPERQGAYVELANPYLPKPEDIAAVIENGLVLNKKVPQENQEIEKKEKMQEPAIAAGNPQPDVLPEQQPPSAALTPGSQDSSSPATQSRAKTG